MPDQVWLEGTDGGAYVTPGVDYLVIYSDESSSPDEAQLFLELSLGYEPNKIQKKDAATATLAWFKYLYTQNFFNPKNERNNKYQLFDLIDYASFGRPNNSSTASDWRYKVSTNITLIINGEEQNSIVDIEFDRNRRNDPNVDQYVIDLYDDPSLVNHYSISGLNHLDREIISVTFSNYEVYSEYNNWIGL